MKIGLVVRRLSTHGGTERFALGFAEHAREQGHEVLAWVLEQGEEPDGVEVRVAPRRGRGRMGRLQAMAAWASRLPRAEVDRVVGLVRVGGLDVYRAGGGCHAAWLDGRWAGPADAYELHLDRLACREARLVVANSHMAAGELRDRYGVPEARLAVVHNGVELERFLSAPERPEEAGHTAVFVGHGFARKGLETALAAVARVPGLRLLVAGRDRRWRRYARLARSLGLDDRVEFLGAVDAPEDLLRRAGVLILPTRYDPFANVCLEALAAGVPVVTSARNGAAEVLPRPWLVVDDPSDAAGFAAGLVRALREPGLPELCRSTAEAHPAATSRQRFLDRILELT